MPGTLPTLNIKAIQSCIFFGKLINGKISKKIKFDRKHYFYPDLAKGYQITQKENPLIKNGYVMLDKNMIAQGLVQACVTRMPNQNLTTDEARNVLEFMRKNDGKN